MKPTRNPFATVTALPANRAAKPSSVTLPKIALSVPEAAAAISVSERILWRWIKEGRIPTFRPFGIQRVLIKRTDLEAFIAAMPTDDTVDASQSA